MANEGICKLCGKSTKLIKAHILPRGFYSPIWDYGDPGEPQSERVPIIVSLSEASKKPIQKQSGIWDRQILCSACDGNILGPLDKYATHFLIENPSLIPYAQDERGEPILYVAESYDYRKLKLFYMAFCRHIAHVLQRCEAWAMGDTATRSSYYWRTWDATVVPFCYTGEFSKMIQNPIRQRIGGINYMRFRYPGGGLVIKVDQRSGAPQLACVALDPGRELRVITKAYTETQEHRNVLKQLTSD